VEPILSARAPVFQQPLDGNSTIEVQNFGQVESGEASLKIEYKNHGEFVALATISVPPLAPYEKVNLDFEPQQHLELVTEYEFLITIFTRKENLSTFVVRKKITE